MNFNTHTEIAKCVIFVSNNACVPKFEIKIIYLMKSKSKKSWQKSQLKRLCKHSVVLVSDQVPLLANSSLSSQKDSTNLVTCCHFGILNGFTSAIFPANNCTPDGYSIFTPTLLWLDVVCYNEMLQKLGLPTAVVWSNAGDPDVRIMAAAPSFFLHKRTMSEASRIMWAIDIVKPYNAFTGAIPS